MKVALSIIALLLAIGAIGFGAWYFAFGGIESMSSIKNAGDSVPTMGTFIKAPPMVNPNSENFQEVLSVYDKAKEKYKDAVAWLQIPETQINNVVMQSCDNSHYLRRDEEGNESIYGCYFADYACSFTTRDELLSNTVIYGHSDLKDNPLGKRFSQLFKFADEEFAKKNRTISLTMQNEQTKWEIFAVFYTDTSFDYINPEIDGEQMTAVAQEACSRSLYNYGVNIIPEDKILTLSTCSIKYGAKREDIRFVVMARLLPPEGSPSESFSKNPNPKEPKQEE